MSKLRLLTMALCVTLLVACKPEEPEPQNTQSGAVVETTPEEESQTGRIKLDSILRFVPYAEKQVIGFGDNLGNSINYTVTALEKQISDTESKIVLTMRGRDFDGGEFYHITINAVGVKNRQIDMTFNYTFQINETNKKEQIGTWHFEDTQSKGLLPELIEVRNQDDVVTAQLRRDNGIAFYLDVNNTKFNVISGGK